MIGKNLKMLTPAFCILFYQYRDVNNKNYIAINSLSWLQSLLTIHHINSFAFEGDGKSHHQFSWLLLQGLHKSISYRGCRPFFFYKSVTYKHKKQGVVAYQFFNFQVLDMMQTKARHELYMHNMHRVFPTTESTQIIQVLK